MEEDPYKIELCLRENQEQWIHMIMDLGDYLEYDDPDLYDEEY